MTGSEFKAKRIKRTYRQTINCTSDMLFHCALHMRPGGSMGGDMA